MLPPTHKGVNLPCFIPPLALQRRLKATPLTHSDLNAKAAPAEEFNPVKRVASLFLLGLGGLGFWALMSLLMIAGGPR